MYGLVNKAIEQLVRENHGDEAWNRVRELSGVKLAAFSSMDPYPDEVTYQLVAASSEVLGAPVSDLLEAFGEYWTLYTAEEGYGELLEMAGGDLWEFLDNLDAMHERVAASLPELRPPVFSCERLDDSKVELHYRSEREGLAPMVIGLLRGLGKRFETEIEIQHTQQRGDGGHDVFVIETI